LTGAPPEETIQQKSGRKTKRKKKQREEAFNKKTGVQVFPHSLALRHENTINHPRFLVSKKSVSNALKTSGLSLPFRKKLGTDCFFALG
jgi:hypothetical protein